MTVKELIEELEKFGEHLTVVTVTTVDDEEVPEKIDVAYYSPEHDAVVLE